MKEISADKDLKGYQQVFDPSNPEKPYTLNMNDTYDHIILQNLLQIAEKASSNSEGKFDIKACFYGVKLNGKANWNLPSVKNELDQYEIPERSGTLVFTFTINPILFK